MGFTVHCSLCGLCHNHAFQSLGLWSAALLLRFPILCYFCELYHNGSFQSLGLWSAAILSQFPFLCNLCELYHFQISQSRGLWSAARWCGNLYIYIYVYEYGYVYWMVPGWLTATTAKRVCIGRSPISYRTLKAYEADPSTAGDMQGWCIEDFAERAVSCVKTS